MMSERDRLLATMREALREIERNKLKFARALWGIWKGAWWSLSDSSFAAFCRANTPYSSVHCSNLVRVCDAYSDAEIERYGFTACRVALRLEGAARAKALQQRAKGHTVAEIEIANGFVPSSASRSTVSGKFFPGEQLVAELSRQGKKWIGRVEAKGVAFSFELSGKHIEAPRLSMIAEKNRRGAKGGVS